MIHMQNLFYLLFLHLIIAKPQLNLYYTDWIDGSESEYDNALQHNCLRIVYSCELYDSTCEVISYCMNELPSKFNIENTAHLTQFTFDQLKQLDITSQQLYYWSTPIDLIERYQFYLNQLSTGNNLTSRNEIFYNCTMPRFGPKCQYQLYYHYANHSSINDIINSFYETYGYRPTTLTCYTHLKCNRGPYPLCLDWSEICDGKIDCLNDGVDEKYCWLLEINECKNNEDRVRNGQCLSQFFLSIRESPLDFVYDFDQSHSDDLEVWYYHGKFPPIFALEELTCISRPLTSSCKQQRVDLLIQIMYSNNRNPISEDCWSAFQQIFNSLNIEYLTNEELYQLNISVEVIINTCPDIIYFPNMPIAFGDIYFVYIKNDTEYSNPFATKKSHICYNNSNYDHYFVDTFKILLLSNNMKCIDFTQFLSRSNEDITPMKQNYKEAIIKVYNDLLKYHLVYNYNSTICNRSNMYQCQNSLKCISIYRLMNTIYDCPYMDDENITLTSNIIHIGQINKYYFKCSTNNIYISKTLLEDGECDCGKNKYGFCDDEDLIGLYLQKNILFQHICDEFIDLLPILIEDKNETDETECEQWECNNMYTHCNDIWNCPNGADETGCITYLTINCSLNYHYCVSPQTNELFCLPVDKANDGHIDCLGARDEPGLCAKNIQTNVLTFFTDFYCINQTSLLCLDPFSLCNGYKQCEYGDDEQFCTPNRTINTDFYLCINTIDKNASDVEKVLCYLKWYYRRWQRIYFRLDTMDILSRNQVKNMKISDVSSTSISQISDQYQPRCHRGLDLIVWLNNTAKMTCLCPLNYYGDQCQYQNQRISLNVKFRALPDSWQTLFSIVILLIDDTDQRIVHSYEQIHYLWLGHCQTKFHHYLVYSTRPKDLIIITNYSIHIDIYEKDPLKYRGSFLFPVEFSFLPVHRLTYLVDIPRRDEQIENCLNNPCIHGKCIKYLNNSQNASFCQCETGWSGRYCNIEHVSKCSSDSIEIGISANKQSICVCPLHKFGSRCLLTDPICLNDNNSICQHDGQCISSHEFMIPMPTAICICREGYSGKYCEIVHNTIILLFNKNILVSQELFIHFFQIHGEKAVLNTTTFKTIPLRQDSIEITWIEPFHLVFLEFPINNYYLIVNQTTYTQSTIIKRTINPSDRCPPISELFNQTFAQLDLIRRIKYYHLPCQKQSLNLSCFYDDVHLCLCYTFGPKRLANCFNFVHNRTFNCLGKSLCENKAQCFQDKPDCPTRYICRCQPCYYGRQCQFSTSGFGLSLDAILGYHILPNITIIDQPAIVQFSLILTIIFTIIGFIDGILCVITFKNKIVCEVGCGLYLLCSSITTLITMFMFGLKFFILLSVQMKTISDRLFINIQCHALDFILRICLNMNQWLNACIAIERAYTVIKGTSFDKRKTKKTAKITIVLLLIIVIGSTVYDPVFRNIIDEENDNNEKRIWCIVRYSSGLQIYNYIIHTVHFFGPFIINLLSSIMLIIKKSRQESNLHKQQSYRSILKAQIREHNHLLIAPIVLVILGIPRLILIFISKCMKTANDSWPFLIGYFISFIPTMLTFLVFIVPSKFYKKEFKKSVAQVRTAIQRRLHLTSP